jgi:uncharacterized protein
MVTLEEIQNLAQRINAKFHTERIILFGSYARGNPTPDSDVDLLVILPFDGKGWRQAAEIRAQMQPNFPLDLLVRKPAEIHRRLAAGDPFIAEVMETGKVLL